ncbi:CaiB/BaiF CoA transferase family protein [Chachezhania sediminis]|uniref:CaiB/BaiF CoA transferase family protein n=1 Tax=Chachezhania sediminis TaxID=2599291 RepID=UPI00131CDF5A|nr:CaiB/BaiF CoA-transferase family protein [Chachezhania sediminis]
MMQALDGIRVLDMGRLGPSAMASMYLADFGAEVISVTAAGPGDMPGPDDDFWSFASQMTLIARSLNRNKDSLTLNLKDPADRDRLLELADGADVVIEDFRPGTADRLGVGYRALSARNPRLIYCALSGYGQTGPLRGEGGHDLNFIARAGLLDLIGPSADAPPVIPLFFLSDFGGAAMHAVTGMLMALLARDRIGQGQLVDISFVDSALGLANPLAYHLLNGGEGFRRGALLYSGSFPHYALYRCLDGGWLAVGCFEPWLWQGFCEAIGLPQHGPADLMDPDTARLVRDEVAAVLAQRTAAEWDALLGPKSICVSAVQTLGQMLDSDLAAARDLVAETRHPQRGTERHLANPIRLSRTPARIRKAAPEPGEDSQDIMERAGRKATGVPT